MLGIKTALTLVVCTCILFLFHSQTSLRCQLSWFEVGLVTLIRTDVASDDIRVFDRGNITCTGYLSTVDSSNQSNIKDNRFLHK